MRITRVGEHGLQLTRLGFVNCYLVREDAGYTLIDASLKGSADEILKATGTMPIKRILLTHPHVDHVGSVDALIAKMPDVPLGGSERIVPLLHQPPDKSLRPGETGPARGGLPGIASKLSFFVEDGDRVGSLLAISTPGHIHGHLAFLDERDGTLYAGDELATIGGLRITGWAPWWFPMKAFSDRATAKQTAVKLLNYDVRRYACGHGSVVEGDLAVLQQAIAEANL
ncbi:MBL fold metallo-hydrolase [Terriglobus roseus]|uniref:Glyoxylase, beta-lactamase superfamily II n=1 Tax=Terriglobus roseus TaxID=392734 RepID=A0A1H4U067_9BACT|nr:MBL fold metallo-hydrolase [Terriglobus roseus]SEC62126.1 Glyoxylase, beta-lactamase superfamily II [Terriglobus roseus]